MDRRNEVVASMAVSSTKNIPVKWAFRATGAFIVNDQDTESFVGEVWYQNALFEIGPAIKVREWVFCLERDVESVRKIRNISDDWFISAFKGKDHFTFDRGVKNELGTRNVVFMEYVCCTFWPILHPETFDGIALNQIGEHSSIMMNFKTEMFPDQ
jgi:hypothetical protein